MTQEERDTRRKIRFLEHAFSSGNFCRIHKSMKVTPAMEAGVTERLWDMEDVLALL